MCTGAQVCLEGKKEFKRLPTNVQPIKYWLNYHVIDLERYRFEGKEVIDLMVHEPTRTITCHAVDLWVKDVKLTLNDGKDTEQVIEPQDIVYNASTQEIKFCFEESFSKGDTAKLALTFHGILNDELHGFYRSEYIVDGKKKMMATTQFEACDARRAFVCWDEPAIKAKYQIQMVTSPDLLAISNTSVLRTHLQPRPKEYGFAGEDEHHRVMEKVWSFAETPIMSTYLVALVVGTFDFVSDYTKEGVLVSVYTPPGKSHLGEFALSVATQALSFYSTIYKIPYPLQKLDMLAIPDFAAGAMENWGCITYRETCLLIDATKSSIAQKTSVARTVSHELAHQWFGNLVTMEWWTSLWLNEGFARFMEFEAVDHIFPEWKVWEMFVQQIIMGTAMGKDAMLTSHPIEVPVGHPDEVDQIFDVISYAKGASLIRMLSEYLGRETFYQGIHNYLVKHSYGNAYTHELWDALELASGKKIVHMMNSWTLQTGFPVLTMLEDVHFTFEQERFLSNPSVQDETSKTNVWSIPLTACTNGNPSKIIDLGVWIPPCNSSAPHKCSNEVAKGFQSICGSAGGENEKGWVKINPNQSGFYLVNYTPDQWRGFIQPIKNLTLNTIDRMSLLSGAFSLVRSGRLSVTDAFDITTAFINEPEYVCWKEMSYNLHFYLKLVQDEAWYPLFQAYVRKLYRGISEKLTLHAKGTDTETTGLFRRIVFSVLGAAGEPNVISTAKERFQNYAEKTQADSTTTKMAWSPDLRAVVFSLSAQHGDASMHQQLIALYNSSDFAEERLDILAVLGYVPCSKLKLETLEWSLKNVRSQDIQYPFASVASSPGPAGRQLAWSFLQTNWERLNDQFPPKIVGRIVCAVISSFKQASDANEVEAFMRLRRHKTYERSLEAALEDIRIRDSCFTRDQNALQAWLMRCQI